jgi:hypothetical protein
MPASSHPAIRPWLRVEAEPLETLEKLSTVAKLKKEAREQAEAKLASVARK